MMPTTTEAVSDLSHAGRRYIERTCIPEADLAQAAGIGDDVLDRLRQAHCVPDPTYRVYANGAIRSAVAELGLPQGESLAFYGRSVRWWLRRAAEMAEGTPAEDLPAALRTWLAEDMSRELRALEDAHANGWGHIVSPSGEIDTPALAAEVATLWVRWMAGAWAVCLREFDGHHLITKEAERVRIARITGDGQKPDLEPAQRLALLDAIVRLDSVLLPFTPHERAGGTPGQFIDGMISRYRLGGSRPIHP